MTEDMEDLIDTTVDRLMDAVAAYDSQKVSAALKGAPLLETTIALAYALHKQEVANEALTDRVNILNAVNARLFSEKREAVDKVAELREILNARTLSSKARKVKSA